MKNVSPDTKKLLDIVFAEVLGKVPPRLLRIQVLLLHGQLLLPRLVVKVVHPDHSSVVMLPAGALRHGLRRRHPQLHAAPPGARSQEVLEAEAEVLEADAAVLVVVQVVEDGVRVVGVDGEAGAQLAEVAALDVPAAVRVASLEQLLQPQLMRILSATHCLNFNPD